MFGLFTVQSKISHAQTVWQFLFRKLFTLNADVPQKRKLSTGTKYGFKEFYSCA